MGTSVTKNYQIETNEVGKTITFPDQKIEAHVREKQINCYFQNDLERVIYYVSRDGTAQTGQPFSQPNDKQRDINVVVETLKVLGYITIF